VIAICLARYLPRAEVQALDISSTALQLARENATMNGVDQRIEFLESDWFAAAEGAFDLIVSNPPYVAREEMAVLPREVRDHEPHVALDGGTEGLEQIERIVRNSLDHTAPDGWILIEIGASQGARVGELMTEAGLSDVSVLQDLSGKDRFAAARRAT
jgi:release factor glutamine methyltransferase